MFGQQVLKTSRNLEICSAKTKNIMNTFSVKRLFKSFWALFNPFDFIK